MRTTDPLLRSGLWHAVGIEAQLAGMLFAVARRMGPAVTAAKHALEHDVQRRPRKAS